MKVSHESRRYNSFLNVSISVVLQVVYLLVSFAERTVFIRILGEEILGLSGLFSSFLSFLSLADLGLSSAFTYCLYKPIAEKDSARISTLITFYKKFYRVLCVAVFSVGMLLSPIVMASINDISVNGRDAFAYYILILLNSALSYLSVYKTTLFQADQRAYIVNLSNILANVIATGFQIAFLYFTGSYLVYLSIRIIVTLLRNVIVSAFATRRYKSVFAISGNNALDSDTKGYFITSLKNLFIYKVGTTAINNCTNIIISIVIGTVYVGLYSNYSMVGNTISNFISIFNSGISGSVGNLGVTSTPEKKKKVFFLLASVYFIIAAFCTTCLYLNLSDFISVWLGAEYVLPDSVILSYLSYFFLSSVCSVLWMTREANGLFTKVYPALIARAVINISLSTILGHFLGIGGIFIGSSVAIMVTNMWYEPKMLCRDVFFCPLKDYISNFIVGLLKSIIVFVVSVICLSNLATTIPWMIFKCAIVGVITVIVFSRDIISVLRRG